MTFHNGLTNQTPSRRHVTTKSNDDEQGSKHMSSGNLHPGLQNIQNTQISDFQPYWCLIRDTIAADAKAHCIIINNFGNKHAA